LKKRTKKLLYFGVSGPASVHANEQKSFASFLQKRRLLPNPAAEPTLRRMPRLATLPGRTVLAVTGADRVTFLNGLVSNDVSLAAPGHAVWAALLNPQGKWLADFFILADAERLLLDCAADRAALVAQRLSRFRLRADAQIEPTGLVVHAAWDGPPAQAGIQAPDPRLPGAGWRILSEVPLPATATEDDYDAHRLALGLPDGARDLEAEKTVLLEAGFDELNGISWTKGCYMGQELTARTRYRGLLKRRLLPVSAATPLPPHGTQVLAGERDAGEIRSVRGTSGLALLRLDALAGPLHAAGIPLSVRMPDWAKLPEPA
jgi:folate-binding protein YgfZ